MKPSPAAAHWSPKMRWVFGPSAVVGYGISAAAVAVITCLRLVLNPVVGPHAPYLPFVLAIMVSARVAGRNAGLLATAFSMVSVTWFFLEPRYRFMVEDRDAVGGLVLFMIVGVLISLLVGRLRSSFVTIAQTEARLRESESFFRQTLESIPGMVFTTRPDGYCDYQSQQWVDYTGVPLSEHLGDGWQKLLHPDDRPQAFAAWTDAVEGRAPYNLEYRVRRHDGQHEWFKVIGRPIRDTSGKIVRWFGVALNIEELKRAEAAQKASEESLRAALEQRKLAMDAANLGSWDFRLDTQAVFWDERSCLMFGLAPRDRVDFPEVLSRIHPDDRAAVDSTLKSATAGENGGAYDKEFRVIWDDGSVHWIAGHGRVFFAENGGERRAVRFVGVNMDITGRKAADERLRQMQKFESIGLLAGGVAHDFNNILTVIMGSASSALEQCPSCEHSQAVLSASKRAAYLTKQLLAYAGKAQYFTRLCDVTDLVAKSAELLSVSVPKRVSLAFDLAPKLPPVEVDPSQIDQILMNLVINGAEAMPPRTDGRIEITTSVRDVTPALALKNSRYFKIEPGRYVCLDVKDNGAGMDEATASRIFEPFFTTKFTGRGLGLAAVDGIVRTMKGFIDVESSPGRGAAFRVYLPAAGEPAGNVAPSMESEGPARHAPHSAIILVVDDEDMVRRLACTILRSHGYEVLEAKDGMDALRVLDETPAKPDAVLLDIAMPFMGGDELVPILREKYPKLKVVVSSGFSGEEARKGLAPDTVAGYLQKPYTVAALTEAVADVLQREED